MNKKKKNVICSLIISIIVLIVTVLYLKTDFLKTKEQLFWKYFLKEKDEIINVVSNDRTKEYNNTLKKSSYIKEGNISITSERNYLKPLNIKISEKGNNNEKYRNIFIDMKYNNKEINQTTIIEDDDYYIIKNDLLNDNFIGFENNNLKQVAKKLGLANTDFIPNKIKEVDYLELLSLTDDESGYILKKYIPICRKYVKNKHYIKEENVKLEKECGNITKYEVHVTEKQFNDLLIGLLNELSNDEKTLNIISRKITLLDETNMYCKISNIKSIIGEWIDYLEKKNVNDEIFLSIIIYKKEKDVIKTELVLNNDRTISIQNDGENKIVIKQYDVKDYEPDLRTLNGTLKTFLNTITEITYEKQIENNEINRVSINAKCNFGIEQFNITYNYVEQIKNNVEEIIRKDDIVYLDLSKISNTTFENMIQKALDLSGF